MKLRDTFRATINVDGMSVTTISYDREQIERAIKLVEGRFPDQIERIGYSVHEDWAGDPAIYFRVLLKDSPDTEMILRDENRREHLFQLSRRISDALQTQAHVPELQPYVLFRSVSEQETLRDPAWD